MPSVIYKNIKLNLKSVDDKDCLLGKDMGAKERLGGPRSKTRLPRMHMSAAIVHGVRRRVPPLHWVILNWLLFINMVGFLGALCCLTFWKTSNLPASQCLENSFVDIRMPCDPVFYSYIEVESAVVSDNDDTCLPSPFLETPQRKGTCENEYETAGLHVGCTTYQQTLLYRIRKYIERVDIHPGGNETIQKTCVRVDVTRIYEYDCLESPLFPRREVLLKATINRQKTDKVVTHHLAPAAIGRPFVEPRSILDFIDDILKRKQYDNTLGNKKTNNTIGHNQTDGGSDSNTTVQGM